MVRGFKSRSGKSYCQAAVEVDCGGHLWLVEAEWSHSLVPDSGADCLDHFLVPFQFKRGETWPIVLRIVILLL